MFYGATEHEITFRAHTTSVNISNCINASYYDFSTVRVWSLSTQSYFVIYYLAYIKFTSSIILDKSVR